MPTTKVAVPLSANESIVDQNGGCLLDLFIVEMGLHANDVFNLAARIANLSHTT